MCCVVYVKKIELQIILFQVFLASNSQSFANIHCSIIYLFVVWHLLSDRVELGGDSKLHRQFKTWKIQIGPSIFCYINIETLLLCVNSLMKTFCKHNWWIFPYQRNCQCSTNSTSKAHMKHPQPKESCWMKRNLLYIQFLLFHWCCCSLWHSLNWCRITLLYWCHTVHNILSQKRILSVFSMFFLTLTRF